MHLSQQVLSASETYLSQTGPLNKINRLIKLNNPIHIITIKATNPNSSPSIQRNATQYKVRSDESKATKPLPHPLLFSKPHPPKTPNAPKEKAIREVSHLLSTTFPIKTKRMDKIDIVNSKEQKVGSDRFVSDVS
jgi:hypothetical protein